MPGRAAAATSAAGAVAAAGAAPIRAALRRHASLPADSGPRAGLGMPARQSSLPANPAFGLDISAAARAGPPLESALVASACTAMAAAGLATELQLPFCTAPAPQQALLPAPAAAAQPGGVLLWPQMAQQVPPQPAAATLPQAPSSRAAAAVATVAAMGAEQRAALVARMSQLHPDLTEQLHQQRGLGAATTAAPAAEPSAIPSSSTAGYRLPILGRPIVTTGSTGGGKLQESEPLPPAPGSGAPADPEAPVGEPPCIVIVRQEQEAVAGTGTVKEEAQEVAVGAWQQLALQQPALLQPARPLLEFCSPTIISAAVRDAPLSSGFIAAMLATPPSPLTMLHW